jgi:hypothetical protein
MKAARIAARASSRSRNALPAREKRNVMGICFHRIGEPVVMHPLSSWLHVSDRGLQVVVRQNAAAVPGVSHAATVAIVAKRIVREVERVIAGST